MLESADNWAFYYSEGQLRYVALKFVSRWEIAFVLVRTTIINVFFAKKRCSDVSAKQPIGFYKSYGQTAAVNVDA